MAECGPDGVIRKGNGQPPYDPRDHLKLYLYGYLNKVRSSRCLERETQRNLEVIWMLGGLRPSYKTIADFRKDNAEPLKAVNKDFVLLCRVGRRRKRLPPRGREYRCRAQGRSSP